MRALLMPDAWAYARQPTLDYQQRVWIEELCISWVCVCKLPRYTSFPWRERRGLTG